MSTLNTKRGKLVISANSDGMTTDMDCRFRYSIDVTNGTCTYKNDGTQVSVTCNCNPDDPNYVPEHCPLKQFDALNIRRIAL